MSEISVSLDSIRARIVDRVAQASGTSSGPSENSNGLLPLGIEDEQAFRTALDTLGAHSESLSLLVPRCFDGPPPKNVKRAPESGLLSDHQWRRYGKGAGVLKGLPASIHVTTVNSRMSLLDDLAVSEEIRHYPDHERSTNSTGMW